jgi:hypothetical protein
MENLNDPRNILADDELDTPCKTKVDEITEKIKTRQPEPYSPRRTGPRIDQRVIQQWCERVEKMEAILDMKPEPGKTNELNQA